MVPCGRELALPQQQNRQALVRRLIPRIQPERLFVVIASGLRLAVVAE